MNSIPIWHALSALQLVNKEVGNGIAVFKEYVCRMVLTNVSRDCVQNLELVAHILTVAASITSKQHLEVYCS